MLQEPDYKKILEYVGIMKDMIERARKAKTTTEKVENLGLVSEACKQLTTDFETWIAENDSAIDEAMAEEAEPRKRAKKSKFVPKLVEDDDNEDDENFEMGCSDGGTVIEE